MSKLFTDTSPEAEEVLLSLMREAPAWRKLEMVDQMNQTARSLALSGLRKRHPHVTDEKLQRMLAELMLGSHLVEKAYNLGSEQDESDDP